MKDRNTLIEYPKYKSVLIVADGPSAATLRTLRIPNEIYVIGVNGAVQWLPRVDAFFTLDPSKRNRRLMVRRRSRVKYYAAVPDDYGTPTAKAKGHRAPRERGVTFLRRIPGDGPTGSCPGMSNEPDSIHSGNSAWGALGIAHHMGAEKIGIVGVDGDKKARISGGRPNSLTHLPWLFSTYNGPAEVVNGSPESTVTCFPKLTVKEVLQWLR